MAVRGETARRRASFGVRAQHGARGRRAARPSEAATPLRGAGGRPRRPDNAS